MWSITPETESSLPAFTAAFYNLDYHSSYTSISHFCIISVDFHQDRQHLLEEFQHSKAGHHNPCLVLLCSTLLLHDIRLIACKILDKLPEFKPNQN